MLPSRGRAYEPWNTRLLIARADPAASSHSLERVVHGEDVIDLYMTGHVGTDAARVVPRLSRTAGSRTVAVARRGHSGMSRKRHPAPDLSYYAIANTAAFTQPVDQHHWPAGLQALGRGVARSSWRPCPGSQSLTGPLVIGRSPRPMRLPSAPGSCLSLDATSRGIRGSATRQIRRAPAQSRSRPPARRITGRERGHTLLVHAVRHERLGVS